MGRQLLPIRNPAVATIGGQFVLSISDTPLAHKVFGRFHIEKAPVT